MTRKDIANKLAVECGITVTKAHKAVNLVFRTISDALSRGERCEIRGFGTLSTRTQPARMGYDPNRRTKITIPEKTVVRFKPSKQCLTSSTSV